jgi:hypothetical protein
MQGTAQLEPQLLQDTSQPGAAAAAAGLPQLLLLGLPILSQQLQQQLSQPSVAAANTA